MGVVGVLLSSFFWTYSAFQIPAGWLADRFDVNWVLAAGFLLWSATTAATGLIHGFSILIVVRLLLGVGESVAYPCYSKILAGHFAEHQRGLANSLIDAGAKCGPALGTLVGGLLMARFGWRPFFVALGLASLLWLPLWFKRMPRRQEPAFKLSGEAPGIADILRRRAVSGGGEVVGPPELCCESGGSGSAVHYRIRGGLNRPLFWSVCRLRRCCAGRRHDLHVLPGASPAPAMAPVHRCGSSPFLGLWPEGAGLHSSPAFSSIVRYAASTRRKFRPKVGDVSAL
jgi:MFS family permease